MSSDSSSVVDKEECGLCGWGQTSKMCTSCEQKIEQANADMSSNVLDSYNTSGSIVSSADAVADGLGRIDISNDDDDKLFADPPPKEDCPICMLPTPHADGLCGLGMVYMPCCGKTICEGCSKAEDDEMRKGNIKKWCALCRVPIHCSDKDMLKRYHNRMDLNDADAYLQLGLAYGNGDMDLPQDINKANELLLKAAELGSCNAHALIATAYMKGDGVEKDMSIAIRHWNLAAIGGHEVARYNLGVCEYDEGNVERSYKHFMIAARSGHDDALKEVGEGYKDGHVTKDKYMNTLRAYQVSCDDMKSKQRDIAAAQDY